MKVIFSFVCFFLSIQTINVSYYVSLLQLEVVERQELVQKQYDSCLAKEMQLANLIEQEQGSDLTYLYVYHTYVKSKLIEKQNKLDWILQINQQLYDCQQILFEQGKEWRGFIEGGHSNETKQIKGNKNLPIYGSMKAENHSKTFSCLADTDYSIQEASEFFMSPSQNGYKSAGTWQYPQGGLHLGMDYALPLFSEIVAPANGLILYADACVDSDNGYLGNWCGWPQGAGNSICMLCSVQDTLYAVTFAHLSDQIYVSAGQQVLQGDVLALSGNSGNSSGPHTHIEVFKCNVSLNEIVNYFIDTADFSFGNGWDTPQTCSQYACRIRPESVF